MNDEKKTGGITVLRYGANTDKACNAECEQHGGNCCQAGMCCAKLN